MEFKLTTSKFFYNDDEKEEVKDLFSFEKYNDDWIISNSKNCKIEISSLKQLIEFTEEYGEIVLLKDTIEIYNYYRE